MLDENTKFDFKKLHKALSDTYKRQMEIKKEFPHRFEYPSKNIGYGAPYNNEMERRKPWQNSRAEFDSLSDHMTMLCCIINHAKGKLHMSQYWGGESFTKEDQEAYIYNSYEEFELKDDETVVEEHVLKQKKSVVARFAEALGL